jgi:putative salt-induced outer membrane protein
MKKILLSLLLVVSAVYAEPTGIEQQVNNIDIQIKKLQDQRKILEVQLVGADSKKVLEEKKVDKKGLLGFTTHTEIGYIKTTGNTDTVTYNIDIKLKKEWEKHILALNLIKLYGEEDGLENKNKIFTELDYNYKVTDRFAIDYMFAYKEDKFSGFDYQIYTGPGLVYKVIDEEKHNLSIKGNILYSLDEIEDTYLDGSGNEVSYPYPSGSISQHDSRSNEYASYKIQALYEWLFSEKTKFTQDLRYRSEFDGVTNYFVYSKSAFQTKLSDMFSASISYQIDYINEAAEGKQNADKTTMFNLIIDY